MPTERLSSERLERLCRSCRAIATTLNVGLGTTSEAVASTTRTSSCWRSRPSAITVAARAEPDAAGGSRLELDPCYAKRAVGGHEGRL
jgi:hypothetical protein